MIERKNRYMSIDIPGHVKPSLVIIIPNEY